MLARLKGDVARTPQHLRRSSADRPSAKQPKRHLDAKQGVGRQGVSVAVEGTAHLILAFGAVSPVGQDLVRKVVVASCGARRAQPFVLGDRIERRLEAAKVKPSAASVPVAQQHLVALVVVTLTAHRAAQFIF